MKIILIALLTGWSLFGQAQISHVSLTASGLTCSMCSKAIYKSLSKLPAVEKVDVDIDKSSYILSFKPQATIDIASFKKAVLDAGFSVASLSIQANFNNEEIRSGGALLLGANRLTVVGAGPQVLNGTRTLLLVDKGYIEEKERRKYDPLIAGAAANSGAGLHVVLQKS